MSGSKTIQNKNGKDYSYLNYLNMDGNGSGNDNDNDNDNDNGEVSGSGSSDSSSYVPREEESSSSENNTNTSQETEDESVIPPPSYLQMAAERNSNSNSNNVVVDQAEDSDCADSEDGDGPGRRRREASGGTYLSLDHRGTVFAAKSNSMTNTNDDDDDVRSISSVPRNSLPPPSVSGLTGASLLSLHQPMTNDELQRQLQYESDDSFLLPPPDASDYAPADICYTPTPTPTLLPLDTASTTAALAIAVHGVAVADSSNKENKELQSKKKKKKNSNTTKTKNDPPLQTSKPASRGNANINSKNNKIQKPVPNQHEQQQQQAAARVLRAEEEQAATTLAGTIEVPPPPHQVTVLPPNHYSHLLKAYEFVEDPSIPPLPPNEFVLSPTDEDHQRSPNTSYEDDIEVGEQGDTEAEDQDQQQPSARDRRRKGAMAGLFTIFSPPASTKLRKDNTPDTEVLSTTNDGDGENDGDCGYGGRQLFSHGGNTTTNINTNNSSFDEGYEGGDSENGLASVGEHRRSKNSKSHHKKSNQRRRKVWIIIIVVLFLILVAASSVIAYAMYLQYQEKYNSNNINSNISTEAVVEINIAPGNTVPNPDNEEASDTIIIAITNQTKDSSTANKDSTNPVEFEWVTTTAPFAPQNASSLRPVTPKNPTDELAPSLTSAPTPTPMPTPVATKAPPTLPPTTEEDFVGRLQLLLQLRNYRGPNGQVFLFDFSSTGSMSDPVNLALIYLAREIAAVRGLPDPATTTGNESFEFVPVHLQTYDDEKLVQRFALLSLQFGASTSENGNAFVGGGQVGVEEGIVAVPAKRIVVTGDDALLDGTTANGSYGNANSNLAPIDSATLLDPNDARFLVDECDWEGIDCASNANATATIVTKIRWDYRNLDGSIAPTLSLLTSLTSLDLSNNDLQGSIPESLYKLTDLEDIYLFRNELTGTLSKAVGNLDKLKRFHLSHNVLTGTLPAELKSDDGSENDIRPIEYFNIYSNQFTGSLPSDLRWRKCVTFDAGRNQLTGTLPADLGDRFASLRFLFLDHNAFSGTLPPSYNTVGNGRLSALAIESNRLTGVVPGERDIYDNLVQYTLHDNLFVALEQENCRNNLLVEFKADCSPNKNVCTCFGRFFNFCERWCGYDNNDDDDNDNDDSTATNNPSWNSNFDSNPDRNWSQQTNNNNNNWQQQQQQQNWQQRPPSRNWSF